MNSSAHSQLVESIGRNPFCAKGVMTADWLAVELNRPTS